MRFEIELTGLDEVQRTIGELGSAVESISGEQQIAIAQLFPAEFLARYTQFTSLEEMFEAGGFVVETAEDFERIPGDEWDDFIRDHTQFSDWNEMLGTGSQEWVARKLRL